MHKPTIWEALATKMGREPTHAEACADVKRILEESMIERAEAGKLKHGGRGYRSSRDQNRNAAMSHDMKLKSISFHRNGIDGEGFHVVLFSARVATKWRNMVATAFDGDGRIAILDVDMAAAGNIAFSENSWRYEHYADAILGWIKAYRDGWSADAAEGLWVI